MIMKPSLYFPTMKALLILPTALPMYVSIIYLPVRVCRKINCDRWKDFEKAEKEFWFFDYPKNVTTAS
jgi:hypothetical protein